MHTRLDGTRPVVRWRALIVASFTQQALRHAPIRQPRVRRSLAVACSLAAVALLVSCSRDATIGARTPSPTTAARSMQPAPSRSSTAAAPSPTTPSSEGPARHGATERAAAAALAAISGGTVRKVERGDEGVGYAVEVRRPTGGIVQVLLDTRFRLVAIRDDLHEAGGAESGG